MPPRRTHTKSRTGCDQCKKRRVKCDERGPPCSNCISRELACSYLKVPVARAAPVAVPYPKITPPTLPIPQPASRTPPSRFASLRELELMHKFSTETYQSLCNEPADHHVWQSVIPRTALEHDFLMSGLLAVASLHIASALGPAEALSYIDTALEYHDLAFAPFRHAVDNLTPANCDAVLAHSVITTIIGVALPQLAATREESNNMTENIIIVFELLHGVSNIFTISRPWLQAKLFTSRQGLAETPLAILDSETEAALDRLTALNNDVLAVAEPKSYSIIKEAIALLRRCFCRYNESRDIASVLAWLATADKEFVHALRCRQPLALLVIMHWGALLHELDGKVWWAKNSGTALVSELVTALRPGDVRWEGALQWPKRKLGL
ncbi:C6 transcription factor [Aspergillus heteromorphus CBS 117.55]|uniref:C6 transcription factor n=1 Tax=Aspergillus heteromorphus CBS 117.55 TaxID=1448321 RepID=A0A317WP47_9EURO|nr:C6 transcription factor [Aspergillus heteromorphus CBS 117.55]PWY88259.1 C6 transcription factor [Aspergillus heteromorphus CBS 117.55]